MRAGGSSATITLPRRKSPWTIVAGGDSGRFSALTSVTRADGFLARSELVARYEERSGRSMAALNWYQALAVWKAAVFMEGNYKRFMAGDSDDSFLAMFDEGVPALAEKAKQLAET
jgi:aminoglycoside phosphotransferase (APT) family kinase protein